MESSESQSSESSGSEEEDQDEILSSESEDVEEEEEEEEEDEEEEGLFWHCIEAAFCLVWQAFNVVYNKFEWINDAVMYWLTTCSRRRPCGGLPTVERLANSCETCDWRGAFIRGIACNETGTECVVLTSKDVALLYKTLDFEEVPRILRSPLQKCLTCAAFEPWSTLNVAVGGVAGIGLWQNLDSDEVEMSFMRYYEAEYIVELQWIKTGQYLVSATLGNGRIQIWQPDELHILQELQMPGSGSHCWALRHPTDLVGLIYVLSADPQNCDYENSLRVWSEQLTNGEPLQTAAWIENGDHLLYVLKESSRVYVSSVVFEADIEERERQRKWISKLAGDLSSCQCNWEHQECGSIQAMSMDPLEIFAAFIFRCKPFVMLCVLDKSLDGHIKLQPVQFIYSAISCPETTPSCFAFCYTTFKESQCERSVLIAWSTGNLQTEQLLAHSQGSALQLQRDEIRCPPKIYNMRAVKIG